MARPALKQSASLALVCGEDEFAVKQRAKQLFTQWSEELGGMDHETIDGSVSNSGEALRALAKLREALQTLPFFGSGKVVWLRNCNFLGDERTAMAQAVTESLAELAQELKDFQWQNVRLLISAGKVDKRKAFYKALDKLGTVEILAGWSADDKDWAAQAEAWALKGFRARHKEIGDEALAELINRVGPNARQLETEIEKVSLFAGDQAEVTYEDVTAICSRNKTARAFALGDAVGDRNLPELLRRLDEELWEVKLDPQRSEIGLLYGLISKVRALILLKEMLREGWLKPGMDYGRFKAQLEKVPADQLPEDRRFNPLALNPYVLFKALPQVKNYSQQELISAMDLLFRCNHRLVSSGLDEALILQQTLVQIVGEIMSTPAAKLLVLAGEKFACIRIIGRANFTSSIDFKILINELRQAGYDYFVLELSECVLMDSTFLGVLAGFGLKLNQHDGGSSAIELLNPTPRITELLENLGVLHLFKLAQGPLAAPTSDTWEHAPGEKSKEQVTRACLEAHRTLMEINPENVARFKDVAAFLAEDLKKLKGEE